MATFVPRRNQFVRGMKIYCHLNFDRVCSLAIVPKTNIYRTGKNIQLIDFMDYGGTNVLMIIPVLLIEICFDENRSRNSS